MTNVKETLRFLLNRALAWGWSKVGHVFGEKAYLQVRFRLLMGRKLDLKNPTTFSEKMQWLKLYDRRPEYSKLVDKFTVKEYVASIIGNEYIIPTLGVWAKPEDIEWDKLPNKFVLKTTNGAGSSGVIICKNKNVFDRKGAIRRLNKNIKYSDWRIQMEWPYKNVVPRIIAEQYIEPLPELKDLPDYKFFCFNGEPKYCQVISGRDKRMCIDFFDLDWNHMPFHEPRDYPFADAEPERPENLEKMSKLSSLLAVNKPFSRIDFYDVGSHVYFGEITFYPTGGIGGFDPEEYDHIFGNLIHLPS